LHFTGLRIKRRFFIFEQIEWEGVTGARLDELNSCADESGSCNAQNSPFVPQGMPAL
jgi:hypothetical protein